MAHKSKGNGARKKASANPCSDFRKGRRRMTPKPKKRTTTNASRKRSMGGRNRHG